MKLFFYILGFVFLSNFSAAQSIVGLPMAGHVTANSVQVLVIAKNADVLNAIVELNGEKMLKNLSPTSIDTINGNETISFYKVEMNNLLPNSDYKFHFFFPSLVHPGEYLKVKTLSEEEVYNFDFAVGSCLAPFKGVFLGLRPRLKIFDTMRKTNPDFMIWMGDNVYFLSEEWNEYESMNKKMLDYRKEKHINRFLNNQPNYSTWDDHDFGPDNSHGGFDNKEMTKAIFNKFWENPRTRPDSLAGIFYKFSHADADFFIMDSRFNRVPGQEMYGKAQLDWLKEELKESNATFKFIVSGTQSIPSTYGEDWGDYGTEKANFLQFIEEENITGLIFFSGDTHYAELNKLEREDNYSLVEITSSALTSPTFPGAEKSNKGIRELDSFSKKKNFGHISIKGKKGNRFCKIDIKDKKGKVIWTYKIHESELVN